MSVPALLLEPEHAVEERVAVLEANIGHIRADIADMKIDLRRIDGRIDTLDAKLTFKIEEVDRRLSGKIEALDEKLTTKIDAVDQKLTAKIDAVDQKLTGRIDSLDQRMSTLTLSMEKGFGELRIGRALDRVWWLLMLGALLAVMARGFKWI